MLKEYFIVYYIEDLTTSETHEVSKHLSQAKAQAVAEAYTAKHGVLTTIDWQLEEITANGREILDTEADNYGGAYPPVK